MIHFIIPLYNKENSVAQNIHFLYKFLKSSLGQGFEIVLSDDGSTDKTLEAARSLEESLPGVRVVGYSENKGRGYAIKYAARSCTEEHVIFMDLDFPQTTSLERILEMAAALKNNHVVIGSRFLPGSNTKRFLVRGLVSKAYRILLKIFFPGLGIKDPDIGFKGFKTHYLHKMSTLSRMDGWSWDLETLIIAQRNHLKTAEIPIDWNEKHTRHTSSVNILKASLEQFLGILKIKKNLKNGAYDFHKHKQGTEGNNGHDT